MPLGQISTHQTLLNKMAEVQGFDLSTLRATGVVSDADAADLLTRCRGCADPAGCSAALDAGDTPTACANASRWDALHALDEM